MFSCDQRAPPGLLGPKASAGGTTGLALRPEGGGWHVLLGEGP